jgi:hypothetical protein
MSEHALQVSVAHMLQLVLDPGRTWWSAIDHGAGKLSKRSAGMMKARGVRAGMPDFLILVKDPGARGCPMPLGIELKYDRGRLSPAQVEVADAWSRMGEHVGQCAIYVARSLEEVQEILEHCNVPMLRRMNFLGGGYERSERSAPPRHRRPRQTRKSKNHLPLVLANAAQKN